jgi:transposase
MKLRTQDIRDLTKILDDIIEHYNSISEDKKRDWRTYEQRFAERVKKAMKELSPLVEEAISTLNIYKKEKRGNKPKLTLKQKVVLLLIKHFVEKSNRTMANMLVIFTLLTDVDVSYKSVERLYSDPEVKLALYNLHMLILKKKGVKNADCGGDGTGYSLTITKHYASEAQRLKEKAKIAKKVSEKKKIFVYSFTFLDLNTRMYVAYGTSFHSEKEAFLSATKMAKEINIDMNSIRLDKYFSAQDYVRILTREFGDVKISLIPKKNATVRGPWEWKRMLYDFVTDPTSYLEDYFQRNQSESSFAEDKKRTGWVIMQRREDRVDTADFCNVLWHNLFWMD